MCAICSERLSWLLQFNSHFTLSAKLLQSLNMSLNLVSQFRQSLLIVFSVSRIANCASSKSSCTVWSLCVTHPSLAEYFWIITRQVVKSEAGLRDAQCNWYATWFRFWIAYSCAKCPILEERYLRKDVCKSSDISIFMSPTWFTKQRNIWN